ncbi:hypothetical protein [Reichenbachiella sp. MALMAid0571]|uniref:hypothetical protein n=1 Tax=Reichenbachiella sp. MALMAid0571 TaxID=3143939 RepID=UPI0032DF1BA4
MRNSFKKYTWSLKLILVLVFSIINIKLGYSQDTNDDGVVQIDSEFDDWIEGSSEVCVGNITYAYRTTWDNGSLSNLGVNQHYTGSIWVRWVLDKLNPITLEFENVTTFTVPGDATQENEITHAVNFPSEGIYNLTIQISMYNNDSDDDDVDDDDDGSSSNYEAELLNIRAYGAPDEDDFIVDVNGASCIKEVTPKGQLTGDESNHNIAWGTIFTEQKYITKEVLEEDQTFLATRTITDGAFTCSVLGNVEFDPYEKPVLGEIVKLDSSACEAVFGFQNADPGSCRASHIVWNFGDGLSETVYFSGQYITSSQIFEQSIITHNYDKTSEGYGGGAYDVSAQVYYNCNINGLNQCQAEVYYYLSDQEILGPQVILTPSYHNTYCSSIFDYDVQFKDPYTNDVLDYVQIVDQTWSFTHRGNAISSKQKVFVYHFDTEDLNNVDVNLEVSYLCRPCGIIDEPASMSVTFLVPDMLDSQSIQESAPEYGEVLNTAASEFNSAWPLAPNDQETYDLHPYDKGSAGVWRTEAQYVFNTGSDLRSQGSWTNMEETGTFVQNSFVWNSLIADQNPNWLIANQITQYNSSSNEIENKDVQNVYLSAIYTYDQKFPLAVGQNMAHSEMAFTGFEEIEDGYAGNFFFSDDLSDVPFKIKKYRIKAGLNNIAIIDAPLATVAAIGTTQFVEVITPDHATKVKIYCSADELENGEMHVFADFNEIISEEIFRGYMVVHQEASGIGDVSLSNTGHTGTQSLSITGSKNFRQHLLDLENEKYYFVSAWVAVSPGNAYYNEPLLANGLGIDVIFTVSDVAQSPIPLATVGPIVEGWQQIEGTFQVPVDYDYFELQFKSGEATTAYFDDLRLFPLTGNMQSYVYDDKFRVSATLDENNFATLYSYDAEGKVYQVRKETTRGIRTIQESTNHTVTSVVVPE